MSTVPASVLAIVFIVLFATGVLLILLAHTNESDQPVGYNTVKMRGGGYADSRLFYGGLVLMGTGFAACLGVITALDRFTRLYRVPKKEIRLFSWVKVPSGEKSS